MSVVGSLHRISLRDDGLIVISPEGLIILHYSHTCVDEAKCRVQNETKMQRVRVHVKSTEESLRLLRIYKPAICLVQAQRCAGLVIDRKAPFIETG